MMNGKDAASGCSVGAKLKQLRNYRCVTQSALAGDTLTRNMLSQIERGASLPSYNTICLLAEKLSVDPSYFFPDGPSLDEVKQSEALNNAREHFARRQYDRCLCDVEELSSFDNDELLHILSEACYKLALDAFYGGRFDDASDLFTRSLRYGDRSLYGCSYRNRISFFRLFTDHIRSSGHISANTILSYLSEDSSYSDVVQYVLLNTLIDNGQIDDAMRIYPQMNIKNAFYKSHFNARIAASMNNYDRAKSLLFEILDQPGGVPAPIVVRALDDLERYCRATEDYEGAYKAANARRRFK